MEEKRQGNGILIAGTGSGSGKTTFTCGLLRAMQKRGLRPCAFKCGPDYIDPSFHRRTLGVASYNLDPFFLEEKALRELYLRHAKGYDVSVIEGVMGYYDGLGFTDEASTYTVARALETPVILLVDGKGMGSSVMAVVEGFLRHREPSKIAGVVFNRFSKSLYEKAGEKVEQLGVRALGYLPYTAEFGLDSRHLGLVMAGELEDCEEKIERIAESIEETVDVEGIWKLACDGADREGGRRRCVIESIGAGKRETYETLQIAVARDEAFCFLYEDNLNLLKEQGADITFFSPLHDKKLPENCSALYLSGGYPELYADRLAGNLSMKRDIKSKIEAGMPCIAECGGFLYLHEWLEAAGKENPAEPQEPCRAAKERENGAKYYDMAGVIPAEAYNRRKKGKFGYIEVTLKKDCLLGKADDTFRAHEFHYWESTLQRADLKIRKPGSGNVWQEGFCTDTLYAGFVHLYFYGSPQVGTHFVTAAREYRKGLGKA